MNSPQTTTSGTYAWVAGKPVWYTLECKYYGGEVSLTLGMHWIHAEFAV